MQQLLALTEKELLTLFGSPRAYLILALFALTSSLIFFDHIRFYNQLLFLHTTTTLGGFDVATIPDSLTIRRSVFLPVMDTLGFILVGLVPLLTMHTFTEERSRRTDQLLLVSGLSPNHIVTAKFVVYLGLVLLSISVAFIYPITALGGSEIGLRQLLSAYLGLTLHAFALASIGLAASALTNSQPMAAICAWAIGFTFWDLSWIEGLSPSIALLSNEISLQPRFSTFSDGIINLSDLMYFIVIIAVSAVIARSSFDWRRIAG